MNRITIGQQLRRAADLRAAGRAREAIALYEQVLAHAPDLADTWYNLGLLRRRVGQPEAALSAYDEALSRGAQGGEEIHLNKAIILSEDLRQPDAAQRELERALGLNPAYTPALLNLGNLCEDLGDSDGAISAYERVLAQQPDHPVALSRLADMGSRWAGGNRIVERLRAALGGASAPGDRAMLMFALARRLDAGRMFEEAFATASSAQALNRQAAGPSIAAYDHAAMERRVSALCQAFQSPEPPRRHDLRPVPIFIVGMFRSGSTLLEQILAGHPQISAGGELTLIPRIVRAAQPYPMSVAQASGAQLDQLAEAYCAETRKAFPDARFVTDKRPDNFEHVGLIKRMFPGAKVIYTRRHPLDVCLSTHFLHLDASIAWAATPESTAHQIVQCEKLMKHWCRIYPDDILTLDYEGLLASPETEVRRALSFLDLPWSERCLDFQAGRSHVRTASVWQVREPLHTRSVGRWRNYSRQLAEAARQLVDAGLCSPGEDGLPDRHP